MTRYFPKEMLESLERSIHAVGRGSDDVQDRIYSLLIAGPAVGVMPYILPKFNEIFVPVEALDPKNEAQLDEILNSWQARQAHNLMTNYQLAVCCDYYSAPLDLGRSGDVDHYIYLPLTAEALLPHAHARAERKLVPELVEFVKEIMQPDDPRLLTVPVFDAAQTFLQMYDEKKLTFYHTAALVDAMRKEFHPEELPECLQQENYRATFRDETKNLLCTNLNVSRVDFRDRIGKRVPDTSISNREYLQQSIETVKEIMTDKGLMKESLIQEAKSERGALYCSLDPAERNIRDWARDKLSVTFPILGVNLHYKKAQILMLKDGMTIAEAETPRNLPYPVHSSYGHRSATGRPDGIGSHIVVGDSDEYNQRKKIFPENEDLKLRVLVHEVIHGLNARGDNLHSDVMNEEVILRKDRRRARDLSTAFHDFSDRTVFSQEDREIAEAAYELLPKNSPGIRYFSNGKPPETAEEYGSFLRNIAKHVHDQVINLPEADSYKAHWWNYRNNGMASGLMDEQLTRFTELAFFLCETQDDLPGVMKFMNTMFPERTVENEKTGTTGNLTFGLNHMMGYLQQNYEMAIRHAEEKIDMSKEVETLPIIGLEPFKRIQAPGEPPRMPHVGFHFPEMPQIYPEPPSATPAPPTPTLPPGGEKKGDKKDTDTTWVEELSNPSSMTPRPRAQNRRFVRGDGGPNEVG